jgi:HNH endonuclease
MGLDLTPPEFNTAMLNDHDLLHGGVRDLVIENQANARRWVRMVEIHRRHPDTDGNFPMTAREWTTVLVSEVWGIGDRHARHELNVALFLAEHLPDIWVLCQQGVLDRARAVTIVDILRHHLDDPADWVRCGEKVVQEFDDGMGQLAVTASVDDVRLARHRLHLSAKERRAAGDERTIDQLMSDLALDLLIGRADGVPVPAYARPVVNVTVSLETLAALRDDPAQLSGGTVVPAELARAIATREGATWYRMLTDPAGDFVALSTRSYRPTGPIWRHVVAAQPTCAHPSCDRPSVECELDHVVEWPRGETSTDNLQPLCRRHHKAKHARAERPDLDWEYDVAC